ncbi:MAG: hypothetical protein HY459_05000 [Parcubacteria group bacterium]|nr:hypothetical protein [Parcubacteria group bacterium]
MGGEQTGRKSRNRERGLRRLEKMNSEYLSFSLAAKQNPKTEVLDILSKRHGFRLGQIKWSSAWRQYVFRPEPETVFSDGCLREIADFCNGRTNYKRLEKK